MVNSILSGPAWSITYAGPSFTMAMLCDWVIAGKDMLAAKEKTTPEGWLKQSLEELSYLYGRMDRATKKLETEKSTYLSKK